jgi:hypothetical protein
MYYNSNTGYTDSILTSSSLTSLFSMIYLQLMMTNTKFIPPVRLVSMGHAGTLRQENRKNNHLMRAGRRDMA